MIDIYTLTASQLLAISVPEKLFSKENTKREWQKLTSLWHPDKHPDKDASVLAHINLLYEAAIKKKNDNDWVIPGQLEFATIDGRKFSIRYRKHHQFELGDMYISDTVVAYVLSKGNEDLANHSKKMTSSFRYAAPKMKDEYARYLPEPILQSKLIDGRSVIVYKKTEDVFLLRDVLTTFHGKMEPTQVAWIMSRMYNLSCYLKFAGVAHNHISPDTIFVSPKHHSIMLLGGWWYSAEVGKKLVAVPKRTIEQAQPDLLKAKVGDVTTDSYLIKATGRELLGDVNGTKLIMDKAIPRTMLTWLRTPGNGKPVKDYKDWYEKILPDSFGPRKFVELIVNEHEVYGD